MASRRFPVAPPSLHSPTVPPLGRERHLVPEVCSVRCHGTLDWHERLFPVQAAQLSGTHSIRVFRWTKLGPNLTKEIENLTKVIENLIKNTT